MFCAFFALCIFQFFIVGRISRLNPPLKLAMSEGKLSSSASPAVSNKTVDTIVRAATGVAAAVLLGRFVYQQMFSKPQPKPAAISAETQAKLDNTLERIKRAKVIAILRLKNLEKALERVVELADMGYTVRVAA